MYLCLDRVSSGCFGRCHVTEIRRHITELRRKFTSLLTLVCSPRGFLKYIFVSSHLRTNVRYSLEELIYRYLYDLFLHVLSDSLQNES